MSTRSEVIGTLGQVVALPSGLLAGFLSQASSPDYGSLFVGVAALTLVSVLGATASVLGLEGWERFIPLPATGIAVLGFIEFAARMLGIRLLG